MTFVQAILQGEKDCLVTDDVRICARIRDWLPEFAPKNVWFQVRDDPALIKYLPDEEMDLERWPDRKFFWGVLYSVRPEWVTAYVNRCQTERDKMHIAKRLDTKSVKLTAAWREKLAAHDFVSRQKVSDTLADEIKGQQGKAELHGQARRQGRCSSKKKGHRPRRPPYLRDRPW